MTAANNNGKLKDGFLLKLVLMLSGMAIISDVIIYPAADSIYTVFAGENTVLVNYIITGASLMVIIGSVFCGFLTKVIGKKSILIVSYILFCISSLATMLVDNIYYVVVMRTVTGLMMGFISISSVGLIAELFCDEKMRSWMMGAYTGGMSLIGAVMSYVSGRFAMMNWRYIFYIYLIAVPILLMAVIAIPKTEPEGRISDSSEAESGQMNWRGSFALMAAAFVFNGLYAVILTMISVYLSELGVGDAATAGTMGMLGTLGSMVASFAFSAVYMKTRRGTPIVFSAVLGVGFVILSYVHHVFAIGVAVTFMGAMYGMSYSYYLMYASMIVPPSKASFSISLANAAVYAGIFCAPYICPMVQRLLGLDRMVACMPVLAAVCGGYALLSIGLFVYGKRKGLS